MMGFAIPEQESCAEVTPVAAMKHGFAKLFCLGSVAVLFTELFCSYAPFWNDILLF